MPDVLYASCHVLPEPDPDEQPTLDALRHEGLSAGVRGWDDPDATWDDARVVLPRATWTYPWALGAYEGWLDRVAAGGATLLNPPEVIRWNLHKRYLLQLASEGVPTTPTTVIDRGERVALSTIMASHRWEDVVVKPAVSAGSYRTLRVRSENLREGEEHLASLLVERDVLVQPYLRSVQTYGERALVWIDGELCHAVRKNPRFQGEDENVSTEAMPISDAEARVAEEALEVVRGLGDLLYARIDMAPGPDDRPMIMELELIEPSLFFPQNPAAAARFARAVARRLA